MALPPALRPGDLLAVVAPSSPVPREELWQGLAWLRTRYRLRVAPGVLSRDGYLAGGDDRRRAEVLAALGDEEVRAVVAARGGYGAMRLLQDAPLAPSGPGKWIVGFSDFTTLHAVAWRAGVASIHGPNVASLGPRASPRVRAAWLASIERPHAPRVWRGLNVVHAGEASGLLVGGNLALLHAMAAGGLLELPPGCVLALEDVSEAPYRVDRMLTSLALGGYLARAAAIVFGAFEACAPRADGRTVDEVLAERTRPLGVPVLSGAPFGHCSHNEAFVLGTRASVRGDELHMNSH